MGEFPIRELGPSDAPGGGQWVDRMRVVGVKLLDEFMRRNAGARKPLQAWLAEARQAAWETPAAVKVRYPAASVLSDNRVVFNIGGNNYRLLVRVAYRTGVVQVLQVGTHADYDRWEV